MKSLHLPFIKRESGEQQLDQELSKAEEAFIQRVAFPRLDAVKSNETLDTFVKALWDLCLWERQRAGGLDTKAAALAGLSSLAAAVVSASTGATEPPAQSVLLARCASIAFFIITVLLSLNAQRVVKFGGFIDRDMFDGR